MSAMDNHASKLLKFLSELDNSARSDFYSHGLGGRHSGSNFPAFQYNEVMVKVKLSDITNALMSAKSIITEAKKTCPG